MASFIPPTCVAAATLGNDIWRATGRQPGSELVRQVRTNILFKSAKYVYVLNKEGHCTTTPRTT